MSDSTPIPDGYKRCSRGDACLHPQGSILPATSEYFHRRKRAKDGFKQECKACASHRAKEYYTDNTERILAKNRDWNEKHPERSKAIRDEWLIEHRDEDNARRRRNYAADPEKYREAERRRREKNPAKANGYTRKWRAKYPERQIAASKDWQRRNHERTRLFAQGRRAKERNLPQSFTQKDWQRALDYWDNRCCICGQPAGLWHILAMEHWIPIANTSLDNPGTVPWNILPMCHGKAGKPTGEPCCNNSKRARNPAEWLIEKLGKQKAKRKLAEIEAYFEWVKQSR